MFNKLVISTNERRKGRTVKFFCGTSAIYAAVIVGVLALSVVVSNPKLADTGERMLTLLTPPPPVSAPEVRPHTNTPPPPDRRNTLAPPTDLDKVVAAPTPVNRPPKTDPAFGDYVPDGGAYIPGPVGPGVPGSPDHGETTPPPPQPVAQSRPTPPPPQADVTRPVRLPSSVLQGKAVVRRTPNYPPLARQIRLAGSVSVEVMLGLDGRVEAARAISGHPLLVSAAVEAAREWRFEPTLLNGSPVRVSGVIVFNFTMQ